MGVRPLFFKPRGPRIRSLLFALSLSALTGVLVADDRPFAYTYSATTMLKGQLEYEQWITWKTHRENDPSFDRFDLRHEIEYGVTDRFQLALYVSDWRIQDGGSADDTVEWRDVALEAIHNLSDPTTDLLGTALYGEVKFGDRLFELEGKAILQKNIGPWIFAYNATIEAEWEGSDYSEDNGEFEQTVGAAYQVQPSLSLGLEVLHEIEFADWRGRERDVLYVGPNVSFRQRSWWFTLAPLAQVSDVDGEADFQLRLLFGIDLVQ